jgi:hypothetical protein
VVPVRLGNCRVLSGRLCVVIGRAVEDIQSAVVAPGHVRLVQLETARVDVRLERDGDPVQVWPGGEFGFHSRIDVVVGQALVLEVAGQGIAQHGRLGKRLVDLSRGLAGLFASAPEGLLFHLDPAILEPVTQEEGHRNRKGEAYPYA